MNKGVSPANASPEALVELLSGHATKSVRLALSCFKRWEELEASGSATGVDNLKTLLEAGGAAATVAVMAAHVRADAALAERGCRALATISHGVLENKVKVTEAVASVAMTEVRASWAGCSRKAAVHQHDSDPQLCGSRDAQCRGGSVSSTTRTRRSGRLRQDAMSRACSTRQPRE